MLLRVDLNLQSFYLSNPLSAGITDLCATIPNSKTLFVKPPTRGGWHPFLSQLMRSVPFPFLNFAHPLSLSAVSVLLLFAL